MEKVEVMVESSWLVSQGSLPSTVQVLTEYASYSHQHHQIPLQSLQQQPLTLLPPDEPQPCEITVKFLQRLYHVHGIYILSTSRTCELYSQKTVQEDPEYVCTVRGWVPEQPDCLNGKFEDIISDNILTDLQLHSVHQDLGSIGTVGEGNEDAPNGELGTNLFSNTQLCYNQATDMNSAINLDISLNSQYYDGTGNEGYGLNKHTSSSSDGSWVEIKLPGSFDASSCKPRVVDYVQNQEHGEHDVTQLVTKDAELQMDEQARGANQSCGECNGNNTGAFLLQPTEKIHESANSAETKLAVASQKCISSISYYEADFELVDSEGWEAVTIRLLSLQDKSYVKVCQIVFLVSPGPLAPICNSSTSGDNSALLGMLIPSMLQMLQGVKSERMFSGGYSSNFRESLNTLEDVDRLNEANSSKYAVRGISETESYSARGRFQNSLPEIALTDEQATRLESLPQILPTSLPLMNDNNNLMVSQVSHVCRKNRVDESDYGVDDSQLIKGVLETQDLMRVEDLKAHSQPSEVTLECDSKIITVEKFAERFDRLEQLCLRMESFLHRAVECLDKRLQILEAQNLTGKGSQEFLYSNVSLQKIENESSEDSVPKEVLNSTVSMQGNQIVACGERGQEHEKNVGLQKNENATGQESQAKEVLGGNIGIPNIENASCEEYQSKEVLDSMVMEGLIPCHSSLSPEQFPDVIRSHKTSLHNAWTSAFEAFSAGSVSPVELENLEPSSGERDSSTSLFFQHEDHQFGDPTSNVNQKQTQDKTGIEVIDCNKPVAGEFHTPLMYEQKISKSGEKESSISFFARDDDQQSDDKDYKLDDPVSNINQRWTKDVIDVQDRDNNSLCSFFPREATVSLSNRHLFSDLQNITQGPLDLISNATFTFQNEEFFSVIEETHQLKHEEEHLLGSKEMIYNCVEVDCSSKMNVLSLDQNSYNQKGFSSNVNIVNILEESDGPKHEAMNWDACNMLNTIEEFDGLKHEEMSKDDGKEFDGLKHEDMSKDDGNQKGSASNVNMINVLEEFNGFKHEGNGDDGNQKCFLSSVNMSNILEESDGFKHKARDKDDCNQKCFSCNVNMINSMEESDWFKFEEINGDDCNQKSSSSNINKIKFLEVPYCFKNEEMNGEYGNLKSTSSTINMINFLEVPEEMNADNCNPKLSSNVNMINFLEKPDWFKDDTLNGDNYNHKFSSLDADCNQKCSTGNVTGLSFMEPTDWIDHEEMTTDKYEQKCSSSNVHLINFMEDSDGFQHEAKDKFTICCSISEEDVACNRKGVSGPDSEALLVELERFDGNLTFTNLQDDQGKVNNFSSGQKLLEQNGFPKFYNEALLSDDQDNFTTNSIQSSHIPRWCDIYSEHYFSSLRKAFEQEHNLCNLSSDGECNEGLKVDDVSVLNLNLKEVHQILPQIPFVKSHSMHFLPMKSDNFLSQQTDSYIREQEASFIVFPGFEGL